MGQGRVLVCLSSMALLLPLCGGIVVIVAHGLWGMLEEGVMGTIHSCKYKQGWA